jgi:hypothetical protein
MNIRKTALRKRLAMILRPLAETVGALLFGGAVMLSRGGDDTDEDVDIQVGDRSFNIAERTYTPILCELPAGRHTLVMTRGGQVLCREEFVVGRGEEIVLTAWGRPEWDEPGDAARARAGPPDAGPGLFFAA